MEIDLRRLIDALPGLVWTTTPEGDSDFINQRWREYAGLSTEEARSRGWKSTIHPDDLPAAEACWDACVATEGPGEVEARLRRFDGIYRRFNIKTSPLTDAAGRLLGWCGVNTDIEDHVRAEEAVRDEQRRFQVIIDGLPAIVALFTSDGRIQFCNRQMLDYLDETFDEVRAKPSAYNFHPDDREAVLAQWATSVHSGETFDQEARLQRADGAFRWHRTRVLPLRNAEGIIDLWYGLSIDVDDAKRAEAEVREHQRRFRQIVDDMPAIVALFAADGPITFSNKRMLDYYGQTLEQFQQGAPGYTFHPDDRAEILGRYRKAVETGEAFDCETRLLRRDGVYRWHLVRGFPLHDSTGRIELWCGLFTDIEEARAAQAQLAGEKRLLELVATGVPLADTLDALCREVETLSPGSLCSILLVEPGGAEFRLGAGPSLPDTYTTALDGVGIDPNSGPCGLAVTSKALVISADVAGDERWAASPLLPLAAQHELAACWSAPILAPQGAVLGTFAVYRRQPASPRPDELELIDRFVKIASIAIERAQADTALRASEAELQRAHGFLTEAQRLSKTASFTWDEDPTQQVWSDEMYRILGLEPGTRVGLRKAREIIHPEDVAVYDAMAQQGQAGENMEATYRVVTGNGEVKHVHVVARRLPEITDRQVYLGAMQDVSDAKRIEAALRASEAELRQAYDFLNEAQRLSKTGSFTWDVLKEQSVWSEEMHRIFDVPPDVEPTNNIVRQLTIPEDVPILEALRANIEETRDFDIELRLQTGSGAKHVRIVAHRDEQIPDRPVFIGATQDVTGTKLAELALDRARAELSHVARVAALSALTASIAHEVNQPLAGIITNASTCLRMLAANPPNVEGAKATAQRTIRDGNRASEVIQRLRAMFARKAPTLEPIDLNDAAREVLTLSASDLQRRRVFVRADFADALPVINGDRIQLQQVILNLVLNAADALGEVHDHAREIRVTTAQDDSGSVRLTVRDNGVGFDPQTAERLFNAFYTTKSEGMGIGLSISRSIIEGHGGRLRARPNDDGPGATFAISIPSDAGVASSPDESSAPATSAGNVPSRVEDGQDA